MALGIIFALLCALSKAIDTLINKNVMEKQSVRNHSVLRIIFVLPVLAIAAMIHWKLEWSVCGFALLYGLLEAINIICHQSAIKSSNPIHIEIISRSKVLLALIISFVLAIDKLSLLNGLGIVIFMVGLVLSINYQTEKDGIKTGKKGVLFEIISVIARTFKPFILKICLQKNLVSNETMAFISIVIALVILLAVFRPKISFKDIDVKKYIGQSTIVGVGMLLSGWALLFANVVIVNALDSASVFFVIILMYFLYKKKSSWLSLTGIIISVIGITIALIPF